MRPFERSLPMQLMRAREAVMARFRPHLHARGLTDQQWRIIRALNDAGRRDIAELGERCCIHPASLSRILPKMESDGFISRRTSRHDQRCQQVSLTPRGRRLFAEIAPESEAIYAALARTIGPRRLDELYLALERMLASLAGKQVGKKPSKVVAAAVRNLPNVPRRLLKEADER
jgi:homoprotocatechuate degradation regulator HpaR